MMLIWFVVLANENGNEKAQAKDISEESLNSQMRAFERDSILEENLTQ